MKTADIVKELVVRIGGSPNGWKRWQKFKFKDLAEFTAKEADGRDPQDLNYGDYVAGKMPSSGICRVYVHQFNERMEMGDTTAFVITPDDDSTFALISSTSD